MSTEFVFIGDLHCDALTKYWPEANAMQIGAVARVIRTQMKYGRNHFFLLGDLSEGIRDSTGNAIRLSEDAQVQLLRLFREFDGVAHLYVYLGNHDYAEVGSHSLQVFFEMQAGKMFKTIRFFDKPTTLRIDDVDVCVLPHPHKEPDPDAHFALAHYEVNGAVGDTGRKLKGDDYAFKIPIVQGHLHTAQKVRNHYYPGTLYQKSFGERLPKGYGVARVSRSRFQYKWVQFQPPFELRNVQIEKTSDFKTLVAAHNVRQKLFVADGVRIPNDLATKYPNIVNTLQYASEEELQSLQQAEFELEASTLEFDHTDYLPKYLKQHGASKQQIARAKEILGGRKA